jgi:hypothetical protein
VLSKLLKSLGLLAAVTAAAQADGLVTEVKVRQSGDAVKIVIPANGAVEHRARALGKSVVVDLFPAKLGSAVKADYAVNLGLVNKVHVQQFDESTVRVTLSATSAPRYKLTERLGSRGLVLDVSQRLPIAPRKKPLDDKLVTLNLVNADLGYVIKLLVKKMGHNTYLRPGVEGAVAVKLQNAPAKTALEFVLKSQESNLSCQLVEPNTIVVTNEDSLDTAIHCFFDSSKLPKDAIRQEVLYDGIASAKVVSYLQSYYGNMRFTPHPTKPGFIVTGSRRDIQQFTKALNQPVPEPPELESHRVHLKNPNLWEVKELLTNLIPDIIYTVDEQNNRIILNGSAESVEFALQAITELFEDYREENWFTHSRNDQPGSPSP